MPSQCPCGPAYGAWWLLQEVRDSQGLHHPGQDPLGRAKGGGWLALSPPPSPSHGTREGGRGASPRAAAVGARVRGLFRPGTCRVPCIRGGQGSERAVADKAGKHTTTSPASSEAIIHRGHRLFWSQPSGHSRPQACILCPGDAEAPEVTRCPSTSSPAAPGL